MSPTGSWIGTLGPQLVGLLQKAVEPLGIEAPGKETGAWGHALMLCHSISCPLLSDCWWNATSSLMWCHHALPHQHGLHSLKVKAETNPPSLHLGTNKDFWHHNKKVTNIVINHPSLPIYHQTPWKFSSGAIMSHVSPLTPSFRLLFCQQDPSLTLENTPLINTLFYVDPCPYPYPDPNPYFFPSLPTLWILCFHLQWSKSMMYPTLPLNSGSQLNVQNQIHFFLLPTLFCPLHFVFQLMALPI